MSIETSCVKSVHITDLDEVDRAGRVLDECIPALANGSRASPVSVQSVCLAPSATAFSLSAKCGFSRELDDQAVAMSMKTESTIPRGSHVRLREAACHPRRSTSAKGRWIEPRGDEESAQLPTDGTADAAPWFDTIAIPWAQEGWK
jgi:hypothetical protein